MGANFTQAYAGTWGWSDVGCGTLGPALCKLPPPANFSYDAAAADGEGGSARLRLAALLCTPIRQNARSRAALWPRR